MDNEKFYFFSKFAQTHKIPLSSTDHKRHFLFIHPLKPHKDISLLAIFCNTLCWSFCPKIYGLLVVLQHLPSFYAFVLSKKIFFLYLNQKQSFYDIFYDCELVTLWQVVHLWQLKYDQVVAVNLNASKHLHCQYFSWKIAFKLQYWHEMWWLCYYFSCCTWENISRVAVCLLNCSVLILWPFER